MKRLYALLVVGMLAAIAVGCAREVSRDDGPHYNRNFRGGDHGGGRD